MALVLAAAMTLGTGGVGMVSALAEEDTRGKIITIKVKPSDINGQTFSDGNATAEEYIAYRIFDYTATETALSDGNIFNKSDGTLGSGGTITGANGISYTINKDSPFLDLLWNTSNDAAQSGQTWLKFTKASNGELYVVSLLSDGTTTTPDTEQTAKEIANFINSKISSDGMYRTTDDKALSDGTPEGTYYYKLNSASTTTPEGKYTFTVPRGYYLIRSSLGSNLIAATSDIEITEKNEYPAVTKAILKSDGVEFDSSGIGRIENAATDTETSKNIGDTITYKLTVTVPAEANQQLVLHDIMSPELTLISNSFRVMAKSDGTDDDLQFVTQANNFTITNSSGISQPGESGVYVTNDGYVTSSADSNNSTLSDEAAAFEIVFTDSYIQGLKAKTKIVVTYDAILNSSTKSKTAVNNYVYLDYSQYQSPKIGDDEINVYTYEFDLVKYDGANRALLANAKFNLYRDDQVEGSNGSETVKSSGEKENPIVLVQEDGENLHTFHVYDNVNDLNSTNSSGEFKSTSDGALTIRGLKAGTYWLEEIEAPAGYNRLSNLIKVEIKPGESEGKVTYTSYKLGDTTDPKVGDNGISAGSGTLVGSQIYNENAGGIGIENQTGTELPSTGGIGTTIFYVVGGILVLGAGVLLITKRRVRSR